MAHSSLQQNGSEKRGDDTGAGRKQTHVFGAGHAKLDLGSTSDGHREMDEGRKSGPRTGVQCGYVHISSRYSESQH